MLHYYTHYIRMAKKTPMRRANITIEPALHKLAKKRARDLHLADGFSGYVARLLKLDMKRNRKRVGHIPRLLA